MIILKLRIVSEKHLIQKLIHMTIITWLLALGPVLHVVFVLQLLFSSLLSFRHLCYTGIVIILINTSTVEETDISLTPFNLEIKISVYKYLAMFLC